MSGIEYTVKKVSDEALNEMIQNLGEGRTTALNAVAKRMAEVIADAQRISDQQVRQAEALRRQIIGGAEMTARNKSLEIIEDNLNAAFAQALQQLEVSAKLSAYSNVLKSMILEGLDQIGGESFVVTANSRDQQLVQKIIDEISKEKKVKIARSSSRLAKSIGGVTIASADGYVMFDNTYEARLERLRPTLRKQIAQLYVEGQ